MIASHREHAASPASAFRFEDTHGLLRRDGVQGQQTSERLGWRSMYAAVQREAAFEFHAGAVQDHLIVLHLDRSVVLEREMDARGERRVVAPGSVHIIPGGSSFSMKLHDPLSTVHISLRDAVLREVAAECQSPGAETLRLRPSFGEPDPALERLIHAARDLLADGHPTAVCSADHLARAIAARCIRRHAQGHERYALAPAAPLAPPDVEAAIAFMRDNLGRSISLVEIAATGRHGPSHFSRRFRRTVGVPPHQHLLRMRVERARVLLDQSSRAVADIALECGFASQEHLSRMFKRELGASPGAYRRARRS